MLKDVTKKRYKQVVINVQSHMINQQHSMIVVMMSQKNMGRKTKTKTIMTIMAKMMRMTRKTKLMVGTRAKSMVMVIDFHLR